MIAALCENRNSGELRGGSLASLPDFSSKNRLERKTLRKNDPFH